MDAIGPFVFLQTSLAASNPPEASALSTSSVNFFEFVVERFKNIILSIAIASPNIRHNNTIHIKPGPPSINRFLSS